jgi:UDPglucose--hexose-1-phosphate uridylyltransferase
MAHISFLWHLHQPAYRTADNISHAPWTMLHAGGAYLTLARAIERSAGAGQILNIVPTLLEQLVAYAEGSVNDPVIEAITTPADDLTEGQQRDLIDWSFHVNPRQMARYPRLGELQRRKASSDADASLKRRFGRSDLRDLQVLFVLAQAGEQAWRDERLEGLFAKQRDYSPRDHQELTAWLVAQPADLIAAWRRIASAGEAEIATSPYAHPIMPLLIDTGIVAASWAPHPAPEVPVFKRPDDAVWQLETGRAFMKQHGLESTGCWPPEGSVSEEAVALYGDAGVQWLVTDEGILERSLDRPLRDGSNTAAELYRPWRLHGKGPLLFFRDRHVSDAIGFQYGRWDDEGRAAEDLVKMLEQISSHQPEDAHIVVALDGENPWLHYAEGGGRFLTELMDRLAAAGPRLRPVNLSSAAAQSAPLDLHRLHPGSWINSIFATWIGHPEKTHAWRVLAAVREAIASSHDPNPHSLLLAEGSDWFWWLGDDNPTELAPLYDRIFRAHLADACLQAGVESPVDLSQPLKRGRPRADGQEPGSQLRYCAVRQTWTIIAPQRNRSIRTVEADRLDRVPAADDPFAPGNEHQTPPEIFRLPRDTRQPWQVRVFANSFPALRVEGEVERWAVGLNDSVSGVGAHEVIVETPASDLELADLSVEEIDLVLTAYRARLQDLRRDPRLRYIQIFKNQGRAAGASIAHAHSQLIATPIIPTAAAQELRACREHYSRRERCLFCDLIRQELRLAERICLETDGYLAMSPFAAASPFETWILPKEHRHDFALASSDEIRGLAIILRDTLRRLRRALDDPPYNLVLHTSPNPHPRPGRPDYWTTIEHDYHWHLELVPRIRREAGFEWGSGFTINPTPPEEAARTLAESDANGGR